MKEVMEYQLSEDQMDEMVDKISEKVIAHQEKKKKAMRANAYHNTRLLLRNYYSLKKHCDIVDEQVTEELGSLWSDWRFDLDSLLEHKAKTVKIMRHVDKALAAYKVQDPEAYEILKMKYLVPRPLADEFIATNYDVDRRTIARRIEKSIKEVSVYLFGIEVVVDWV